MNLRYKISVVLSIIGLVLILFAGNIGAEAKKNDKKGAIKIPNHVVTISKENTFPNVVEDQEDIEPSKLTKSLIDDLNVPIENSDLIKLLNESTLNPSPLAVGYRGSIYLGRWPLNYISEDTTVNWEYQLINENELNNVGGDVPQELRYNQENEQEIKGALTSKVDDTENVKQLILRKAQDKSKLPLSFRTVVGQHTKKENYYNVPVQTTGYLKAHTPAVNERGHITYGEVYIRLKGSQKSLDIKNVTKQGIGAWIPIQDHVSFSFKTK